MRTAPTVLLVDDEPRFRKTTEKILRRRGFEVLLAGSGEEALLRLEEAPDVAVLDLKMPGMDGLSTLAEIRRRSPGLPVIMLTGHGSGPAAEEALARGATDFLAKPCDIDLLASRIRDSVRKTRSEGPGEDRRVRDVMVPLHEYTTVSDAATVQEAVERLRESFVGRPVTDSLMETGHRSVLVLDSEGQVAGLLTIIDLLRSIMPAYLSAPKPSLADSIRYSPMFWAGMFTRETEALADTPVGRVMSPPPPAIRAAANLMDAAYEMVRSGHRRMVVMDGDRLVGMIREQDLFFEMERIVQ